MTPQTALSKANYEAIHELLDISLTVDPKLARISFSVSAAYPNISVHIYPPDINDNNDLKNWWTPVSGDHAKTAEEVRAFLTPENMAALAESKRSARIETLRQQLAEAEAGVSK